MEIGGKVIEISEGVIDRESFKIILFTKVIKNKNTKTKEMI